MGKRKPWLRVLFCFGVIIGATWAFDARADIVADWQSATLKLILDRKWDGARSQRAMAILDAAMFDAANAVKGHYAPYVYGGPGPSAASEAAAASQAAFRVLSELMPEKTSDLKVLNDGLLSNLGDPAARDAGIALGDGAAAAVLAVRSNDGADFGSEYEPLAAAPGVYQPTSDAPMVTPKLSRMKPFALEAADQFQVPPPPPVDSLQFLHDLAEVRESGGAKTQTDKESIAIARFHASSGMIPWNKIALDSLRTCQLSLVEKTRALAMLNIAMSDALVAVFKAKYEYSFWRPMTVIRAGGAAFGHPELKPDAEWVSLLPVPMHPEYPCAHCANGGAAQTVLESIFGDGPLAFSVENEAGKERHYRNFRHYAEDEAESRILAGVHYRWSTIVGSALGRQIGSFVTKNIALPRAVDPRSTTLVSSEGATSRLFRCP